jgi:hypothetical protein
LSYSGSCSTRFRAGCRTVQNSRLMTFFFALDL